MRRRVALVVAAVCLSLPFTASKVAAQAHVRVGGFLGWQFDSGGDWLIFGAEGRLRGGRSHFDFQPRFHYHTFDFGDALQLDGNIVFNLAAPIHQVKPYMGAGVAINRVSIDIPDTPGTPGVDNDTDETNFGLNIVSGLIIGTNARWRPYAQFQYTALNDAFNGANIAVGILFIIRGDYR